MFITWRKCLINCFTEETWIFLWCIELWLKSDALTHQNGISIADHSGVRCPSCPSWLFMANESKFLVLLSLMVSVFNLLTHLQFIILENAYIFFLLLFPFFLKSYILFFCALLGSCKPRAIECFSIIFIYHPEGYTQI